MVNCAYFARRTIIAGSRASKSLLAILVKGTLSAFTHYLPIWPPMFVMRWGDFCSNTLLYGTSRLEPRRISLHIGWSATYPRGLKSALRGISQLRSILHQSWRRLTEYLFSHLTKVIRLFTRKPEMVYSNYVSKPILSKRSHDSLMSVLYATWLQELVIEGEDVYKQRCKEKNI